MVDFTTLPSQCHLGHRGIFYIGGSRAGTENKHHWRGQMFIEAYIPEKVTHPYPLILFHGAGQTNVNWLSTPGNGTCWTDYFVEKGYAVFLAEQPSRARSAYHPDTDGQTMYHSLEALWTRFASNEGNWPQSKLHTQWPGMEEGPDGPTFQNFVRSQVEYLNSNKKSQELVLDCAGELLELTGPAILLTHSQAGPFGWAIADRYPELVKGIIALEPSGPAFSPDTSSPVAKNYGLTDTPLHFDPPIRSLDEIKLTLLKAPKEDYSDGWVFADPVPSLPTLQNIPITIIVSESSYHSQYDHLMSYVFTQLGIKHDFIRLEEQGIHGNGHMMMIEKNNLQIADLILNWMKKNDL